MITSHLNITLVAHHNYSRRSPHTLFNVLTASYLPLLELFEGLEAEGIPFPCTIVFSPFICALLEDPLIRENYTAWLDNTIKLGEQEGRNKDLTPDNRILARDRVAELKRAKKRFTHTYHSDIIGAFRGFVDRGLVEAVASAATWCFLPHYRDIPEAMDAQIEAGIASHCRFFSLPPDGFYLPHMGYAPGIEEHLSAYGIQYTILDAKGLLFAEPLPDRGLFSPARTENSLAVFARDATTLEAILGPEGFINRGGYCNHKRDTVFERPAAEVGAFIDEDGSRLPSGYKYWANNGEAYHPIAAKALARRDAREFFLAKKDRLRAAHSYARNEPGGKKHHLTPSLVNVIDLSVLGWKWQEGITWLEHLFRHAAEDKSVACARLDTILAAAPHPLQVVAPYFSANNGSGYGENLLDQSNSYLLRYARKATERMIELATRFPAEYAMRGRMLNLAAKEVLLAQTSDWPRMIQKHHRGEYAAAKFAENIRAFTGIFEGIGAGTTDTEWITTREQENPLLDWVNYRIFAAKTGADTTSGA
jgi:1,4-alpha-glucan branching enzyme